jgi:hypothetical protein
MKNITVKNEGLKFIVYSEYNIYAEIVFEENNIEAELKTATKKYKAERDNDKNIVIKDESRYLFTFKFDYIWGGAEIISNGIETGLEVKGKWFKPGTRLTNDSNEDLIIVTKKEEGLEVTIIDEDITDIMILATIYYHLYTSRGKLLSVLAGS